MTTKSKVVKVGDVLSTTQYFTIVSANPKTGVYEVRDDNGDSVTIEGNSFVNNMSNANQYNETQKVSRTELVDIFKAHPRTAMTVNFNTKINEKEVVEKLASTYPNSGKILSKAEYQKVLNSAVKEALEGNERTMIGRHYNSTDDFGRIHFTDMSVEKDHSKNYDTRTRLVDPRTINWLIVNGVKYMQK